MAHESVIDHIDYDGVSYEFQDSTARAQIAATSKRINDKDDYYIGLVATERERALSAEQALQDGKISVTDNKWTEMQTALAECQQILQNPPIYKGATETEAGEKGYVKQPLVADRDKFLKGNGEWALPNDTTYEEATITTAGLMSAADKSKLDSMDIVDDSIMPSKITQSYNNVGEQILTERIGESKSKITRFGNDGKIYQTIKQTGNADINLVTEFKADGSIERTRS